MGAGVGLGERELDTLILANRAAIRMRSAFIPERM
jgi:hypothetical protein